MLKIKRIHIQALVMCLLLCLMSATVACDKRSTIVNVQADSGIKTVKTEILDDSEITVGDLRLEINTQDGTIVLTDLKTGNVWRSNPENPELDQVAAGENKTKIKSQLYIAYTNDTWQEKTTNSYVDCIKRGNCKYYAIENGFRVEYSFESAGFVIPVEYRLHDRTFTASVIMSEIQEGEKNKLNSITLLPFFGAGSASDKGIIFIPDGSGAVIKMNNGKTSCDDYSKQYYGVDLAYPQETNTDSDQKLLLPVFGVVRNNGAFLARISSGAELATLNASISGKYTEYNVVNTTVQYRGVDRASALKNDANSAYAYLAESPVSLDSYSVDYIFSGNNNPTYGDLVSIYRDVLSNDISYNKNLDAVQDRMYIDLYGGIKKKTSFLGIVYTGKIPITNYSQMQTILDDISKKSSQALCTQITHYSKGEFSGEGGLALEPDTFLGSKKDYKSLIDFCKQENIKIYPTAEINSFRKSSFSFSKLSDAILGMNKQSILTMKYDLSTGKSSTGSSSDYLMNSDALLRSAQKTYKSMDEYKSTGASLTADSLRLYSDFGDTCTYRNDFKAVYEKAFELLKNKGELCFDQAYEYMLPYADTIVNVPISSGSYMLFDYDVPFYQMAIMGNTPYCGKSYNLTNPSKEYFLNCVETMTPLKFTVGYDDEALIGVSDSQLHNINYKDISDSIVSLGNKMHELCQSVDGALMVNFERFGDVSVGSYSNGVSVYTNHSVKEQQFGSIIIPAQDYLIVKEGKNTDE